MFKSKASLLWALKRFFSETGPNSTLAISESLTTLFWFFLIGNVFSFSILLYDLSKFSIKSMLVASNVPAGRGLTFSFLIAPSTS